MRTRADAGVVMERGQGGAEVGAERPENCCVESLAHVHGGGAIEGNVCLCTVADEGSSRGARLGCDGLECGISCPATEHAKMLLQDG